MAWAKAGRKCSTCRTRTPDFIFPIIGEELGLRATLFVVFSFLVVTLSGTVICHPGPGPASACSSALDW